MKNFKCNVRLHLIIIVLLSIATKLMAGYVVGHKYEPQTWEYEKLSQSLLEKGSYSMSYREYGEYKALLEPGYSFMTYMVYKVFGTNHQIMLAIQFLLITVFSLVIYWIAYVLFDNFLIAFIAGILSVLHPGITYYSVANLHNLTLYLPLFYATILMICIAYRDNRWRNFLIIGIIGGFAVLTRATILPVIVLCLAFYCIMCKREDLPLRIGKAGLAIFILVLINLPWIERNYSQFNRFIFSQTNKWEAFWIGNNPNASGGQFKGDGTAVLYCKGPEMQLEINNNMNNEIAIENIFKKYSLKYVADQPSHFIKGLFRKGIYFWWFNPQTGLFYPKSFLVAYKIIYVALLGFAAAGLWICWKRRLFCMEMVFPLLFVVGIWGVHTVNFMEMRHRWTVEPVLLIFASVAIFSLAEKIYMYFSFKNHPETHPS